MLSLLGFFYQIHDVIPAHSRVGKGNLVLRHSVPHFLLYSGGIASCGRTQRCAYTKEKKI